MVANNNSKRLIAGGGISQIFRDIGSQMERFQEQRLDKREWEKINELFN